jgi:hypothetical protein
MPIPARFCTTLTGGAVANDPDRCGKAMFSYHFKPTKALNDRPALWGVKGSRRFEGVDPGRLGHYSRSLALPENRQPILPQRAGEPGALLLTPFDL